MKYEINSTWTRMKEKEITELNNIITNEYCVEQEIGRKLHLIEVCHKAMDDAIKDFHFETVIKFMKQEGWKWTYTINGEAVPTREDFINMFNEHFNHALYKFLELNQTEYWVSSGGINFYMKCNDLNKPSKYNTFCSITFDISMWYDELKD